MHPPGQESTASSTLAAHSTGTVAELPGRVAGVAPDKVQAAVDKLIARLVLFEDLDSETSDIVVDFLPAVREGLDRAGRPRASRPTTA